MQRGFGSHSAECGLHREKQAWQYVAAECSASEHWPEELEDRPVDLLHVKEEQPAAVGILGEVDVRIVAIGSAADSEREVAIGVQAVQHAAGAAAWLWTCWKLEL